MSKRIVNQDALSKFQRYSLLDFRPEVLTAFKRSLETGQLDQVDELYSAMYHEWDSLQKDVNKVTTALGALDFKAVPYADDGEKPTPQAEEVARLVNAALWHAPQRGTGEWVHSFADLIGSVYHALLRGYNVHEIVWSYDGQMYYPAGYLPILPQFFAWEYRAGEKDRLLLYPDGIGMGTGRDFPANKFVVALNTLGVDHPMHNAIFRALVPWFCAAVWGPRWLMQYCQIFGMPFRTFQVATAEERTQLEAKLADLPVVNDVVLLEGETVDVKTAGNSTGIPQQALIELAEKACHKLILGQTLTSDTTKDGGSRAQAEVHSDVMHDEILNVGEFVCSVLNAQLIPAIVRMNYGATQVPMPELRCSLPNSTATKETVDLFDGMINKLGMTLRRSDVYDRLGMAIPDDTDDVLGPAAAPAPGRDMISAAAAARYPRAQSGAEMAARLSDQADSLAKRVYGDWSRPVREALQAAAERGASPAEMLEVLDSVRPDTAALAAGQEAVMCAGLGMPTEEDVEAQKNPDCRAKDPLNCRVHGKGVSREGEGKAPRKPYQGKPGLQGQEKNEPITKFRPVESYADARTNLKRLVDSSMTDEPKRRGIRGRGAVAFTNGIPDDVEFFLSGSSVDELLSGKHVRNSVDKRAHCTAASHVFELWEQSFPVDKRLGRKGERDRNIKLIHVRKANMQIGRKQYVVKMTAKEFTSPNETPVIYHINVQEKV